MGFIKCGNCGYEISRMHMLGIVAGYRLGQRMGSSELGNAAHDLEISLKHNKPRGSDFSAGFLNSSRHRCPRCNKIDWESNLIVRS